MQYDSIVRIFLLPKSHTPHTLVVISLDPPIRKGQTFYPHILVQLPTEEETAINLQIEDEQFNEKNEKVLVAGFYQQLIIKGIESLVLSCPFLLQG